MTELKEFKLPDVGEGLTEADIVAWHVKPGDQVEVNQIIVEIETAKAVVELPSPWDGTVARLLVEEGQTVDVGTPIIAVEVPGAGSAVAGKNDSAERSVVPAPATTGAAPAGAPPASAAAAAKPAVASEPDQPGRQAVLVGYGVKASSTTRRARRVTATRPETAEVPS
ncbi:MAG TPA: biotin/lipoyl-containing protein, partial [Streptosporangiaceae bacterium]|nr:biotin/lipoyl-containing protein [Streptosporangiaceae bacterium]